MPRIREQGSGIREQGSGIKDQGSRFQVSSFQVSSSKSELQRPNTEGKTSASSRLCGEKKHPCNLPRCHDCNRRGPRCREQGSGNKDQGSSFQVSSSKSELQSPKDNPLRLCVFAVKKINPPRRHDCNRRGRQAAGRKEQDSRFKISSPKDKPLRLRAFAVKKNIRVTYRDATIITAEDAKPQRGRSKIQDSRFKIQGSGIKFSSFKFEVRISKTEY